MDETPKAKLDGKTLIFNSATQQQLLWLDGVVVLPIGSVVQLGQPNQDAVVKGVRLWATDPATVILDCELGAPLGIDKREPLLKLV